MKSELETSPDNEALASLGKETPQTATACQGETEEYLTNLDKVRRKMSLLNCSFFLFFKKYEFIYGSCNYSVFALYPNLSLQRLVLKMPD